MECKRCAKFTCIGCRGKPVLNKKNIDTSVAVVNYCCSQSRLFGIWILLCRFDEVELQLQQRSAETVQKNAQKKAAEQSYGWYGQKDTGVGYAKGFNGDLTDHNDKWDICPRA
jgi:baculoviral IAP repeat-containing protein 6